MAEQAKLKQEPEIILRKHTAKSDQRFNAYQRRDMPSNVTLKDKHVEVCGGAIGNLSNEIDISEITESDKQILESNKVEKTDKNHLDPKDEMKILKHWGFLKKTLVLEHIVDPIIENGVISPQFWMALKKSNKNKQDLVEEFLYHILKSKPDTYGVFLDALKSEGYIHIANQLEGIKTDNTSATAPDWSCDRKHTSRLPTNTNNQMLPHQNEGTTFRDSVDEIKPMGQQTGRMGGSNHDHRIHTTELGTRDIVADSAVKHEDLNRMKEEITTELRHLRENIEKDRQEDKQELRLLQRKHSELQEDHARNVGERYHLQKELTSVTDTVKVLKAQLEEKQAEYKEVREKNSKLQDQLEKRSGYLEVMIRNKESEKTELENELKVKDGEYKQLQNMLDGLKQQHEERHTRLKVLTKDKITFEKEVQLLNKEKKNLEVKIRSLEQHIRTLKETYAREIGELKQQLEKYKSLMDEKDKENTELEKRLEESMRDNENLKRSKVDLANNLQKSQNETAVLQQKLHKADLSKYVLPPFLAGNKSTRTGWNPKNLRR